MQTVNINLLTKSFGKECMEPGQWAASMSKVSSLKTEPELDIWHRQEVKMKATESPGFVFHRVTSALGTTSNLYEPRNPPPFSFFPPKLACFSLVWIFFRDEESYNILLFHKQTLLISLFIWLFQFTCQNKKIAPTRWNLILNLPITSSE